MRSPPVLFLLLAGACAAPAAPGLRTWGTFREALRDGRSEARIALEGLATGHTIGVGALAGLAGEITIVDGETLVATSEPGAATANVRAAGPGDHATLLVVDDVPEWRPYELGDVRSYDELEARIATQLQRLGCDPTAATPVRVRGKAPHLALHVIAGSCPFANPGGPPPWRFAGAAEHVELVGFYVEGAAGRLTHHDRTSHLHAVCDAAMGHLDDVALTGAVLLLPMR